jgi:hypothetical protein
MRSRPTSDADRGTVVRAGSRRPASHGVIPSGVWPPSTATGVMPSANRASPSFPPMATTRRGGAGTVVLPSPCRTTTGNASPAAPGGPAGVGGSPGAAAQAETERAASRASTAGAVCGRSRRPFRRLRARIRNLPMKVKLG